jgi:hypothetical protein
VSEDVDSLTSSLKELKAVIGTPSMESFNSEERTTIWETFALLRSFILEQNQNSALNQKFHQMIASQQDSNRRLSLLENSQQVFRELLKFLGEEQDHQAQLAAGGGLPSSTINFVLQEVSLISNRLDALENRGIAGQDLLGLKAQLKLLEARLHSDQFVIGGQTFNSKADVALLWKKRCQRYLFRSPMIL